MRVLPYREVHGAWAWREGSGHNRVCLLGPAGHGLAAGCACCGMETGAGPCRGDAGLGREGVLSGGCGVLDAIHF